jgi:hypothetical protein
MSGAAAFSYFYFMDEYLPILSPVTEANLPPGFITFKNNHFPFLCAI